MRKLVFVASLAALGGCVPPASPSQLLADSAYDMNVASRFGRMDVALEYVGATVREDFTRRHAAWGRDLRVVDVELTSLGMRTNDQADVALSVLWQRSDEAFVRTTQLAQRWQDGRGGWRMTSEKRASGDLGLLDDRPKAAVTKSDGQNEAEGQRPPRRASFQTTIIRATE